MRHRLLALSVVASWGGLAWAEAPATPPALVERLGSRQFREREAAGRALLALGRDALPALKAAAGSPDPETRQRAAAVAARIEALLDTERLLKPTTVDLAFTDLPIGKAVSEFSRLAKTPIVLGGDATEWKSDRKVTVATDGAVPFWDALELFCRKAGVREFVPAGLPGGDKPGGQPVMPGNRINIRGSRGRVEPPAGQLQLVNGLLPDLPTVVAGAVRVRCLPPQIALPGNGLSDEPVVPLQVSLEPRLSTTGPPCVTIARAVSEHGQVLTAEAVPVSVPVADEGDSFVIGPNGMLMQQPATRKGNVVAVRLGKGVPAGRVLSELSGSVSIPVRVLEPLATVENPMEAAGKPVTGAAGVVLEVLHARKTALGWVQLKVRLDVTDDVQMPEGFGGMPFGMGGGMIIRGNVIVRRAGGIGNSVPGTLDAMGLSLLDDKGVAYSASSFEPTTMQPRPAGGWEIQADVTFKPGREAGPPAKLVFTGGRAAAVEVPFAMKNVPLP